MDSSYERFGDFLEDVDILITIRSGRTDFQLLQKLMNAIVASSRSIVETEVVTAEASFSQKTTPSGCLRIISQKLEL